MERINRKIGPRVFNEYLIEIPEFKVAHLDNGMPLLEIEAGSQEIVRVDVVFRKGRIHESKRASSKASFYLLREGSVNFNSTELAEAFDYYGAYVKIFSGMEYSTISLVVMDRYFDKVWPVFLDMLFQPAYSEKEIRKYQRVYSQKLRDQLAKNDVLSYRIFTEELFGKEHPYGYNTQPEDITALTRSDILEYHRNFHGTDTALAVISGRYSSAIRHKIEQGLSSVSRTSVDLAPDFKPPQSSPDVLKFPTDHRAQTSLKIGRRLFERRHPDYSKFQFLNTILGGYFGSRLMKNIREDKGFTYGIYSSVDTYSRDGFFYISADISNNAIDQTIEEIHKEVELLKNHPVPDEEFSMVKNYMLGQILHLIDGPFATGQLIKNTYAKGLDIEYFNRHIEQIRKMKKTDVMETARKYLDKNSFLTVLAGNF